MIGGMSGRRHILLTVVCALWFLMALASVSCGSRPGQDGPPRTSGATPSAGSGGRNGPQHQQKPHVVLISFDGFRHDYLDRFALPNFQRVLRRGVRADAMIPVFPSLTFPNHYSLVTGLYADRHGIVDNAFYDPDLKRTYSFRDPATVTDAAWYRGEPI